MKKPLLKAIRPLTALALATLATLAHNATRFPASYPDHQIDDTNP